MAEQQDQRERVALSPYHCFSVVPQLPQSLEKLRELAWNLRFSWDPATVDLFRMLDPDLFEACGRNPVLFLGRVSQARLEECAEDDAILANLQRVWNDFSKYMASNQTWFAKTLPGKRPTIAYFSAEFGLAGCMPLYSGGLGVLAGDHLKSASDLGLPLVGVGLLYQRGYFHQYLNSEGWQQESYPVNDFHNMPIRPARNDRGEEVVVTLPLGERSLSVKVWRSDVGRVPLYLLDTNIPLNEENRRSITSDLYGGDTNTRLRQEYVLGVGGVRALAALGRRPEVCHMNEGHSAFLALERMRELMEDEGLDFDCARTSTAASNVFTTHTPVRAAIDLFGPEQMEAVFRPWREVFGLSRQEFVDLGRELPGQQDSPFNMAVFALRMADAHNGVSRLHGQVSRKMWSFLWPGLPTEEVPITSITNGVHSQTWISRGMRELLDRNLGPRWSRDPAARSVWEGIEKISPEVLWRTHELQRQRLVTYVRDRIGRQLEQANATAVEIAGVNDILDAGALTIGFARRFAPYKRGNLILKDPERLRAILCAPKRTVQILFAGKAHPQDEAGKKLIQDIVRFSRLPEVKGHVVFIEDYDMDVAKQLVQGVDVWLNTPRRPLEASGTSGMKAAGNAVLNVSVLDGWWDEAATERVGWSIGQGEVYEDRKAQDAIESSALYDLLEHEIVPLFYDRGRDGLPRGWIRMMKEALKGLCPVFNTNRMVHEYATRFYLPGVERYGRLVQDGQSGIKELAAWRHKVAQAWDQVRILEIEAPEVTELAVGDSIAVRARVSLGGLGPEDVEVQLYHGGVNADGGIAAGQAVPMVPQDDAGNGAHWYFGEVPCPTTGRRGYGLRVLPRHADLASPFLPGLIRWDNDSRDAGR